jgi:hypothetical protein
VASQLGIINLALSKLGLPPISDLSEGSRPAVLASATYEALRDELLAKAPWGFAVERIDLGPKLVDTPLYGFSFYYDRPTGLLRLLELNGQAHVDGFEDSWRMESDRIATSFDVPLYGRGIFQRDEGHFSAAFAGLLATYLAAEWAETLVGIDAVAEKKLKDFALKYTEVAAIDAQETGPVQLDHQGWTEFR